MRTAAIILSLLFAVVAPVSAQGTAQLREVFAPGYHYRVSSRVELAGKLTLPPDKEQKAPQTLTVSGSSTLEYDERVLAESSNVVTRSIRQYRRMEFQRKVGEQTQQQALRPEIRRLVILRKNQIEVPFSPDGPLTWGDMDLVRTDVFTPALAGLLPEQVVRVGDNWTAAVTAVQELTDLERIEDGSVSCRLEQLTALNGRRQARVSFVGSVKGLGEDGRSRHDLEGSLYFDLESNHISYLTMRGVQYMLDKDGKSLGKIEGTFVLTRQPTPRCRELDDTALRPLVLEPNDDNTQLLYDNTELGVRFLYGRRWRVAGVRGSQIALDENRGSGFLLTLEPLKSLPTAAQFLQESQTYLQQQKATIQRVEQPRSLQGAPRSVDGFSFDASINGQAVVMQYYVLQQPGGGATVAARLVPAQLTEVLRDVERLVKSVEIRK